MRPYSTARSKRSSPAKPDAISQTSPGMKIIASADRIRTVKNRPENASAAKRCASALSSSFFENSGMKAVLKAPSAKKRRNMLGRDSAIRKASATGPVPSHAAIRISRTKPDARDTIVQLPTDRKPRTSPGLAISSCLPVPRPA